jgi:hypothetical protein
MEKKYRPLAARSAAPHFAMTSRSLAIPLT